MGWGDTLSVPRSVPGCVDVIAHMEASLRRGRSPYGVDDLLAYLWAGRLGVAIGQHMSGSWVRLEGGTCEVGHLAGAWNQGDALWIVRMMKADLAARGIASWYWRGRPGWARFLRVKGFNPEEVA